MNIDNTLEGHLILLQRAIRSGYPTEERIADMQAALHVYVEQHPELDVNGLVRRYESSLEKYRAEFAKVVKSDS